MDEVLIYMYQHVTGGGGVHRKKGRKDVPHTVEVLANPQVWKVRSQGV